MEFKLRRAISIIAIITLVLGTSAFALEPSEKSDSAKLSIKSLAATDNGDYYDLVIGYNATNISNGETITAVAYTNPNTALADWDATALKTAGMAQTTYTSGADSLTLKILASKVSADKNVIVRLGAKSADTAAVAVFSLADGEVSTNPNNKRIIVNYSAMSTDDVKDYLTGLASGADTRVDFSVSNGALNITSVGGATTAYPVIPLGDNIKTADGAFSLRVTAKVPGGSSVIRNFPSLSDGTNKKLFGIGYVSGNDYLLNANNRGDGMWTYKTFGNIDATTDNALKDNNVNISTLNDRFFLDRTKASTHYYTYRWDIDPIAKTFKFFYKKEGENEWIEPWANFNMVNPYESTASNIVRFEEKGVFPTGDLPQTLSQLTYEQRNTKETTAVVSIKSIEVLQELLVSKAYIKNGGAISTKNMSIELNATIDEQSINKDSVLLSKQGEPLAFGEDFTVDADGKKLNISIVEHEKDKKYTLVLPQGKLLSTTGISMGQGGYSLDFYILTEEDLLEDKFKEIENLDAVTEDNAKLLQETKKLATSVIASGVDITKISGYESYKAVLSDIVEVKSATAAYENDDIIISVELDTKVLADTITKESVKVIRGNAPVDYTINKDGTSIDAFTITLKNSKTTAENVRLSVNLGYICRYATLFAIPTDFERTALVLKDSGNNEIYSLTDISDGALKVEYNVINNTYEVAPENTMVYTAVYDDERLLDVKTTKIPALSKGVAEPILHEFTDLEDATRVTTFVWSQTLSPLVEKDEYKKTYGYDNIVDESKDITVAFIGGSITQGEHYSTPFKNAWDADREGKINYINAGVGGTGTNFGSMRLYEDVLVYNPDIVFVEFTLNDLDSTIQPTCQLNVESIIRQCQEQQHEPSIVFIHIPDRRQSGSNYSIQKNIDLYNAVLSHYGLTAINAHQLVVDKVNGGDTWDNYIPNGNVHPNAAQGEKIAELMYSDFTKNNDKYIKKIQVPDEKFNATTPDEFSCVKISPTYLSYDANWVLNPDIIVGSEGYGKPMDIPFDNFVATYNGGSKISFKFTGTRVLVNGLTSNNGRYGTYVIYDKNGNIEKEGSCKSYTSPDYWYENILLTAFGLNDTEHTLEITIIEDKEADAKNSMFGIGEIWVDEK